MSDPLVFPFVDAVRVRTITSVVRNGAKVTIDFEGGSLWYDGKDELWAIELEQRMKEQISKQPTS